MADTNINIHLVALDEATANLNKVQGSLQKMSDNTRSFGLQLRQAGREMSFIGSSMAMAGAAITAPLVAAYAQAGKYSAAVSQQIWQMQNVMNNLSVSIGNALLPAMKQFTDQVARMVDAWNRLTPAQQRNIVQTVYHISEFLVLGGTILMVSGRIVTMLANITLLTSKFEAWLALPMSGWLLTTYAGIGLVVFAMFKWKEVGDLVMNSVQVLVNYFMVGLDTIKGVLASLVDMIASLAAFIVGMIEKIPFFPKAWKEALDYTRVYIDAFKAGVEKDMEDITTTSAARLKTITDVFNGKEHSFADWFDNAKKSAQELMSFLNSKGGLGAETSTGNFFTGFQLGLTQTLQKLYDWSATGLKAAKDLFTGMQSDFQGLFYDAFTGQLKSAQDYFKAWGEQILKIFSDVLAQMVTKMIASQISQMFGFGIPAIAGIGGYGVGTPAGTMNMGSWSTLTYHHSGGPIRAHGGLAVDEVPIIAQTGEGILSRQGMSNLARLNSGRGMGGGGGVTINLIPVIRAWDYSDVAAHERDIEASMINMLQKNGAFRMALKKYN